MFIDIKGYEGIYGIDRNGNVIRYGKSFLVHGFFSNGYPMVRLTKNGKRKNALVHRLIAEAFIPNPNNKPFINHKNGNKKDYSIDNLEWVTHAENCRHAFDNGLNKGKMVLNIATGIFYQTINEAAICHCMKPATLARQIIRNKTNKSNFILC